MLTQVVAAGEEVKELKVSKKKIKMSYVMVDSKEQLIMENALIGEVANNGTKIFAGLAMKKHNDKEFLSSLATMIENNSILSILNIANEDTNSIISSFNYYGATILDYMELDDAYLFFFVGDFPTYLSFFLDNIFKDSIIVQDLEELFD